MVAFRQLLPEEAPGADLDGSRALARTEAFLRRRGYALSSFELVETRSEKPRARRDTEFVWEARNGSPGCRRRRAGARRGRGGRRPGGPLGALDARTGRLAPRARASERVLPDCARHPRAVRDRPGGTRGHAPAARHPSRTGALEPGAPSRSRRTRGRARQHGEHGAAATLPL